MTKVVFQDASYWLQATFWAEAEASGLDPVLVERRNGAVTIRTLARDEFPPRFSTRVAGWSVSAHKSVSVFAAGASARNRAKAIRDFQGAIITGLKVVSEQFTARTGAQGRVRVPADVSFVVAVHVEAKNGSPQLHAHVAIDPRCRIPGVDKEYATDTRELYRQRKLFNSAVSQELASRLTQSFQARVSKTAHGVWLPEVPRSLCGLGSVRSKQIDDFIARHGVKNTPRARKVAALATRTDNRDPRQGRDDFQEALRQSGFRSESICGRIPLNPKPDDTPKAVDTLAVGVGREARRLLRSVRSFSREDLLLHVLDKASVLDSVERLQTATNAVLQAPHRFGLRVEVDGRGKTRFVSAKPLAQWKTIRERVEYLYVENETAKRPDGTAKPTRSVVPAPKTLPVSPTPVPKPSVSKSAQPPSRDPSKATPSPKQSIPASPPSPTVSKVAGTGQSRTVGSPKATPSPNPSVTGIAPPQFAPIQPANGQASQHASPNSGTSPSANEKPEWQRTMSHVFRSYRVVGAVGQLGIQIAARAIELYSTRSRAICDVRGQGNKKTPGSVAALVRDLTKLPYLESHRTALRAMAKSSDTLVQKLQYGERVYARARKPKFRIPRQALIIVRDVEAANPRDVKFLLAKAAQADARVLLVEGQWSQSVLKGYAKTMRPGACHRVRGSEQKP